MDVCEAALAGFWAPFQACVFSAFAMLEECVSDDT